MFRIDLCNDMVRSTLMSDATKAEEEDHKEGLLSPFLAKHVTLIKAAMACIKALLQKSSVVVVFVFDFVFDFD
jgi:hypothetical protein